MHFNNRLFLAFSALLILSAVSAGIKITPEEKLQKAKAMHEIRNEEKDLTGRYVMKFDGSEESAEKFGETYGFKLIKKALKHLKGYLIFSDTLSRTRQQIQAVVKVMKQDKRLTSFFEEERTHPNRLTVQPEPLPFFNVTDHYWPKQWNLHPATAPSLRVHEAWKLGYSGKGIVLAIVDDGIETEHPDLVDNYDDIELFGAWSDGMNVQADLAPYYLQTMNASLSYNFAHGLEGGIHMADYDGHGTYCAGLAAASKNDDCVIGVAYESTIASLRVLDDDITFAMIGDALTHELDVIDIFSNSWGYLGSGFRYRILHELEEAALIQGIKEGRNGKGAIYMFAAGNGGGTYDDCNFSGTVNSVYTIGITALAVNGTLASYSEECTCIMAATYGGEGEMLMATTDRNDSCMDQFYGTSAACPIAAGIVALALQANPDLTWRDVQHLIAQTSSYENVPGADVQTNGAGKNVSLTLGFGIMNAEAMVNTALSWSTVPEKISCVGETQLVYECCTNPVVATYDVNKCHIKYLEHVQVHVSYQAIWREYTEIHLVSPNGTDSRILRQRRLDVSSSPMEWTFMTVFNWGENPTGIWSIRMDDFLNCDNELYLYTWTLTLHGTVTDPLDGVPQEGTLGGRCGETIPCTDGTECLTDHNVCVECNLPDYRVVHGFCAEDRFPGGYCNDSMSCLGEHSWCTVNNTCEQCADGFQKFDDGCFEDGKMGGFCDYTQFCTEVDVGCWWMTGRCVNCSNGYHVMDGLCMEDGTYFGYCDSDIACDVSNDVACANNTCVGCYTYNDQRIFDGFCYDDGTLGGYCSPSIPCTEAGSGCDLELGICTTCTDPGFRIVDSICRADTLLHGYCDGTLHCKNSLGCAPELNVCIECTSPGYRVVTDGFCRQDGRLAGYCDKDTRCIMQGAGCSAEDNMCAICYAGHHLKDGFCVTGKYPGVETKSRDFGLSGAAVAGSILAGLASGVAITAPVFVIVFQKLLMAKINPVSSQNGGHYPFQNGNSRFAKSD